LNKNAASIKLYSYVESFVDLIYDLSGSLFKFVGNFVYGRKNYQTRFRL
jgi:hypothetical protein